MPLIVGAAPMAVTCSVKRGSEVLSLPSETLMVMAYDWPTSRCAGVPYRRPVLPSKRAHRGVVEILNLRRSPLASDATGLKS